jgi:hypothetical protein
MSWSKVIETGQSSLFSPDESSLEDMRIDRDKFRSIALMMAGYMSASPEWEGSHPYDVLRFFEDQV